MAHCTGLVQVVGGVGTVTATIANDVVLKPLAFALNPLATLFVPPPSQDQLQKAYLTDDEALFVEDEEIDDLILNWKSVNILCKEIHLEHIIINNLLL